MACWPEMERVPDLRETGFRLARLALPTPESEFLMVQLSLPNI